MNYIPLCAAFQIHFMSFQMVLCILKAKKKLTFPNDVSSRTNYGINTGLQPTAVSQKQLIQKTLASKQNIAIPDESSVPTEYATSKASCPLTVANYSYID